MSERDKRRAEILARLRNQTSNVRSPPASDGQVKYIRDMLDNRRIDLDIRDKLINELDGGISAYRAGQMINVLKRLPYKRK